MTWHCTHQLALPPQNLLHLTVALHWCSKVHSSLKSWLHLCGSCNWKALHKMHLPTISQHCHHQNLKLTANHGNDANNPWVWIPLSPSSTNCFLVVLLSLWPLSMKVLHSWRDDVSVSVASLHWRCQILNLHQLLLCSFKTQENHIHVWVRCNVIGDFLDWSINHGFFVTLQFAWNASNRLTLTNHFLHALHTLLGDQQLFVNGFGRHLPILPLDMMLHFNPWHKGGNWSSGPVWVMICLNVQ